MGHIDADKLIKSVNNYLDGAKVAFNPIDGDADYYKGKIDACENIQEIIAYLQQEQPNKYETALEKAREWMPNVNQGGHAILIDIFPELVEGLDPRYSGRKQEQPEVDLEEEIENHIKECLDVKFPTTDTELIKKDVAYTARKFYELGFNARKKE